MPLFDVSTYALDSLNLVIALSAASYRFIYCQGRRLYRSRPTVKKLLQIILREESAYRTWSTVFVIDKQCSESIREEYRRLIAKLPLKATCVKPRLLETLLFRIRGALRLDNGEWTPVFTHKKIVNVAHTRVVTRFNRHAVNFSLLKNGLVEFPASERKIPVDIVLARLKFGDVFWVEIALRPILFFDLSRLSAQLLQLSLEPLNFLVLFIKK